VDWILPGPIPRGNGTGRHKPARGSSTSLRSSRQITLSRSPERAVAISYGNNPQEIDRWAQISLIANLEARIAFAILAPMHWVHRLRRKGDTTSFKTNTSFLRFWPKGTPLRCHTHYSLERYGLYHTARRMANPIELEMRRNGARTARTLPNMYHFANQGGILP
jgi:hypothetical protein